MLVKFADNYQDKVKGSVSGVIFFCEFIGPSLVAGLSPGGEGWWRCTGGTVG